MKTVIVIALLAVIGLLAGAGALYGGAFNFAADEPHSKFVYGLIESARENFIERRAKAVRVPALDDAQRIAMGAQHYAPMCAGCHLAPGSNDTEVRQGLYPQPPNLAEHAHGHGGHDHGDAKATAARQFWIIKHGIKASGMPAWGKTHEDESIWALVAFLQKLPEMSPEEYLQLTQQDMGPSAGADAMQAAPSAGQGAADEGAGSMDHGAHAGH